MTESSLSPVRRLPSSEMRRCSRVKTLSEQKTDAGSSPTQSTTQHSPKHPSRSRHHAENPTPLRLTPSSPCQRSHAQEPKPRRKLVIPDRSRILRAVLSRRKRAAAAPGDFGSAETPCSRGASAPLPHVDMNAAPRRSVGGGGDRNRTDDL